MKKFYINFLNNGFVISLLMVVLKLIRFPIGFYPIPILFFLLMGIFLNTYSYRKIKDLVLIPFIHLSQIRLYPKLIFTNYVFLILVLFCFGLFSYFGKIHIYNALKVFLSIAAILFGVPVLFTDSPLGKDLFSFLKRLFSESADNVSKQKNILFPILIVTLCGIGLFLRVANLGKDAFYHDELTQYQALLGLKHAGQLGLYNPFSNELIGPYPRAALLTYFSYFFTTIFGDTEAVVRLPVAIFGWLLLPAIYYIGKKLFGSVAGAIALFLVTFNPYLIYLSRFFRNYSPLILFYFCAFGASLLWLKDEYLENINIKKRVQYFLFITINSLLAFHFGLGQALTLAPLFLLVGILIVGKNLKTKNRNFSFPLFLCTVIFVLIGSLILRLAGITFLELQRLINYHLNFSFQKIYHQEYFYYLFYFNLHEMLIILSAISLSIFVKIKNWWLALPAAMTFFLYLVVAVFGNRYEDFRYIAFVMPILAMSLGIHISALHKILVKVVFTPSQTRLVSLISIVFVFSLPIYTGALQPFWTGEEGAQYVHRRGVAPQYREAFDFINKKINKDKDIVLVSGNEYLYLDPTVKNAYVLQRDSLEAIPLFDLEKRVNILELTDDDVCSNIWFVGAYIHLLHPKLTEEILEDNAFVNAGREFQLPIFYYNDWYMGKNFTWPALLIKENQCMKN